MVLHTLRTLTTADRSQTHQPTTIPDDTVQHERINSSHIDVLWGRVARKSPVSFIRYSEFILHTLINAMKKVGQKYCSYFII